MPEKVPYNQRHAHLFKGVFNKTEGEAFVSQRASEVPFGRYDKIFYGINNEEYYGRKQSGLDQLANGVAKMAGTFTTSFLEGTVGIFTGLGAMYETGKFSSFYNNDFNRTLDDLNKSLEDALPNYYTQAEKDAEWYSPKNLMSTNFLGDKVLKNLGYSFGALAGGFGWGALLKGAGLTNRLVRAGQGLRTVEAVEAAMANAPKLEKFGAINKTLNSLWQGSKNVAGVALTNSERAIISSMGMVGEATVEALQSTNEFRDKLIQDYKNLYGVAPTGDNLNEINEYADSVGNTVFGANAALLTLSNYMQLPKILGSSRTAEKRMINNIVKEGVDPTGKFISGVPSTGNLLSPVANLLGKPGRFINKYALGPGRLLFSGREGVEEGLQYAIQTGTQDYYERAAKNLKEVESTLEGIGAALGNIMTEGVRRALTDKEGLESILIGGFSGALQSGIGNIKQRGISGTGGIYGRNTQLAIDALNKTNIKQVLQDGVRYSGIAIGSQQLRQEAIENNDIVNEKDYEKDFELAYILPRVKYGKLDSITQEVGYYKEQAMSDTGFQELMDSGVVLPGETKQKFLQRLNSVEETAKNVNKLYDSIDEKYSGVMVDGQPAYSPLIIDKLTYAAAKVADYDGRIPDLSTKLIASGIDNVNEIIDDIVAGKTETYKAASEKIQARTDITTTQKTDTLGFLEDVAEMGIRRDKFLKEYNDIIENPEKFDDIDILPDQPVDENGEEINTVKAKTVEGDYDFVIDKEYFAAVPRKSKEGADFKEFTKFKFLGTTENGTKFIIQTPNGKKLTVDANYFEASKIEDVDLIKDRPNAKFYIENAGKIFNYQIGGGKKALQGTIEYNSAKDQLKFVTLDRKRTYVVDRSRFVAKEGYSRAQIYSSGKLTKIAEDALKEPVTKEEIAGLYNERDAIINEMIANNKKRLEEVEKNLTSSKKDLASVSESLDKLALTKKGAPRKNVSKAARKAINELADTKQKLEKNIANLEEEKSELEDSLLYFNDVLELKDELPQEYSELIKELKDDVNTLEDLIDNTNAALKDSKSVLSSVEDALKRALSLLDDFARRLAEENPDFPISVDALREKLEKYLGEEGANQFIADRLGFTQAVMELEDQISLFSDELEIPELTKEAQELKDEVNDLEAQLEDLINKQIAKAKLMEVFEVAADKYKKRIEQEALIQNDPKLRKSLINTRFNGVQTVEDDNSKKYEPVAKKSDEIIWRATMGVNRGKPHQVRANTFGFNFGKFKNKDKIRGVYVTSKNEDQIVPGLTDRLRMDEAGVIDENINKDEIIAMVMVIEDESGKIIPVGVDGQPIPEGVLAVDAAIYQVYPDAELKWGAEFDNESMFRDPNGEGRKDVIDSITEQYKQWRNSVLQNPDLSELHMVDASFGRIQEVKDEEGKVIYETRTSVEDAGLVTADNLEAGVVINIPRLPTKGDNVATVSKGTVTFNAPVGTVFLETPTGLVKLQNRQHTKQEAETIFQAILQLSKYWIDPKIGMKDPKAARLLNWLRSTVYWGLPNDQEGNRKPAGYNSIFFEENEEGVTMLSVSSKGQDFPFSPLSLEENKELIINEISKLYNNVNNFLVNQNNETYEEILSVSENGEVVSNTWKNYQTYLLSNTTPDGKKRSGEQLPLSTRMRPMANAEDINRTDIYFFTTDTVDDFVIPVVKKAEKPKVLTPGAPKKEAKPAKKAVAEEDEDTFVIGEDEEAPPTYVLDGATKNVYVSNGGKRIEFIASPAASPDNLDAIQILNGGDFEEVRDAIKAAGKDPKFEIRMTIYRAIETFVEDANRAVEDEEDSEVFQIPDEVIEKVETKAGKKLSPSIKDALKRKVKGLNNEALRVVIEKELKAFTPENWSDVEAWLKTKFPNVPVYRVKNIIQATNGRQAWGMFKDGAIYIYENAEVGTVYHEVFHAVWRMFSDAAEQKAVLDEMRARGGKFFDRASLSDIKYSEATDEQLEEKLAEEFRDYVQDKKIPAKPAKGRPYILKLFADMVTAIKEFFFGAESDSKVQEMFSKINQGYYKANLPLANSLAYAKEGIIDVEDAFADSDSVLSLAGITDVERSEIVQHMTYLTLLDLIKTDKSLFEVERPEMGKAAFYEKLKEQVIETIAQTARLTQELVDEGAYTQEEAEPILSQKLQLMESVYTQWDAIVKKHEEQLKSYQIEFDENDNLTINDENKTGKETWQDATKIDNFKKANSAVKLLLATIPIVDENGKIEPSSIGGAQLLPIGKTYISLMNNLHTSSTIEEMIKRLREMAVNDPNYRALYRRVTKQDWKKKGVDLSNLKTQHSLQLLSSLWKTFKKQNPDVKNVFILDNGDVVVGEANLSSAAQQLRSDYINSIVFKAKEGRGYFKYDDKDNVFRGNPASISKVNLDSMRAIIDFLDKVGIPFTMSDVAKMNNDQKKVFKEASAGIKESIAKADKIATFSGKVLNINKRLLELALVKSAVANPEFSSTYFNVSGERTQSFIGTNAASDLYEFLSKLQDFTDASVAGTRYNYLKTDAFAKYSNLLSRMFTSEGTRKKGSEDLFRIGYVSGTDNAAKGKKKESSRLTYKERLIQELNLNLAGYYLNLVPGDASIEWMINMGNAISTRSLDKGFGDINEIFKGYFLSELELVRDDRPVAEGRDTKEMRFFKGILGDKLHAEVLRAKGTPEKVYSRFADRINGKIEEFIKKDTIKLQKTLEQYNILKLTEEGYELENVDIPTMTDTELERNMVALSVNYMIANIEMHKLLYSDPYQYEDELKRIKSFNSPRQAIISGSPEMNTAFDKVWNEGYKGNDIGRTKFGQDYFRSATHADTIGVIDLPNYKNFKETDGSGIINMKANRHFRIRASDWNTDEERQYRYDVAWEKRDRGESLSEEDKKKKGLVLSLAELAILAAGNPGIQSAYTPIKPIVSGSKLGKDGLPDSYNNVVLDKFALYPLSYRIMKEINKDANALKLYDKMQKEDVDYIVFSSGRKVGAESPHATYNEDGSFNNNAYEAIINIPFSIMSIQSEVPSKDDNLVTRGSQITKLVTLDFLAAGVPIDYMADEPNFNKRYAAWYKLSEDQKLTDSELYRKIRENQELLEALIEDGYQRTLDRLGIKETILRDKNGDILERQYEITDLSKAGQTLRDEILKRETNDNISDALIGFLEGKVVLEATVAYQQVRNIIYSIADKEFISPKINGGLKVQIPSTLLESQRVAITEINGKKGYTSSVLNFYEKDGKRVAEVMLGRWFDSPLSDEKLLEFLNTTKEGQKILAGIGFRIPTQKQNSIDAIVVKKFLPKEFGDSVVIPAALVAKVGSDFDIDKLSVYLKNVFVNKKTGLPKLIQFTRIDTNNENDLKDFYEEHLLERYKRFKELEKAAATEESAGKLLQSIFQEEEGEEISEEDSVINKLEKRYIPSLDEFILENKGKNVYALNKEWNRFNYRKALENAYIQNMEDLVTHPRNFDNLIKPNSAKPLSDLADFIAKKTIGDTFDYKNVDNMLDRTFMSRLRHAFVTGKYAIGIAAVNQTNHSLNQRQPIYIDKTKLENLSEEDRYWLGNADIKFDKYNSIEMGGRMVPTLSMIKNKDGEYISDIIGMFIDGYVDISKGPWIMELGATPNVASTWLFLIKLGVPVDTVAYFMNQPIVRDYLRTIESAGYSWLFIDQFVDQMGEMYGQRMKESELKKKLKDFTIPSKGTLKSLLGVRPSEMNAQQKTDQFLILHEFLKYAKMGEQMFHFTQGTNYDTSTFNDPMLVFKKLMQQLKAQNTIINSADTLLANSFIGELASSVNRVRDAFAQLLKSDSPKLRNIVQNVLMPYINTSDRDFVKMSQKVVNDLFDWAVQNDQKLNEMIKEILIKDGGVGREVMMFVNEVKADPNHALNGNEVIDVLQGIPSTKAAQGGVNNVKVNMGENKVYDQNNIIYGFRQIREYLKGENNPLYDRIVTLAVLQSGLSTSSISFTSLLPYEDFEKIYNKTLSRLESIPNLDDFYELGVFQRNNWNNDDVVPYLKAAWIQGKERKYYNPSMEFLPDSVKRAMKSDVIPPVLTRSKMNREANSDYIVYTWEDNISKEEKKKLRKAGDTSYINKGLFKKVYDDFGVPLVHIDYMGREYFVYKAINAWGDGFRANEFWATDHKSVINNGFIQVEDVDNNVIINAFRNNLKISAKDTAPSVVSKTVDSSKKTNIYAGTGENANLSNFAIRPFTIAGDEYKSVEQYFQYQKWNYLRENIDQDTFDKNAKIANAIMRTTDGGMLRSFGKKFLALDTSSWDKNASKEMKIALKASFEQNPEALKKLLATGNAELTHTQDNTKWGKEFPKLLMEVRKELSQQIKPKGLPGIKNNNQKSCG